MDTQYTTKIVDAGELFDDYYISAKTLYLQRFNQLPDESYIGPIDGEKAFTAFKAKFGEKISRIYKYRWFNNRKKQYAFGRTIVIMQQKCVLEFDGGYCDIFHDEDQLDFIEAVTALIGTFKERQKREPLEINLVVRSNSGLRLREMEIKRTKLNLDLFYGKDFKETDDLIRKRLNKSNDKGIVLLHGLPGAGKTTYLRYLIGKIRKRVLFLSPSVANNLMDPDFISLLVNNPNTVMIIEDAENIIMDRRHSPGSSVSNLLNISDGLLADVLNVQLVCTFNNSLTLIDSALLRKGRLIAKYEFGKLGIAQSQKLSDHFGFETVITRPMTVAEITNQHEKQQETNETRLIGFGR
jgi:hypothetical protein